MQLIFPLVDLQRDEFIGVGADLISPLLRLLLTDYAEWALQVLDEAEIIPGSQSDKDILRMSLGSTSMKKEYENTATLFGIPDESGWSIPMPAITAATTRNNVHAVSQRVPSIILLMKMWNKKKMGLIFNFIWKIIMEQQVIKLNLLIVYLLVSTNEKRC